MISRTFSNVKAVGGGRFFGCRCFHPVNCLSARVEANVISHVDDNTKRPLATLPNRRLFTDHNKIEKSRNPRLFERQFLLGRALPSCPFRCCCRHCSSKTGNENDSDKNDDERGDELIQNDDSIETPEYQIPGAQAGGKKLAIVYTCKVCETRAIKQFSEHSYHKGVVLIRCPGCRNLHLIADNLGVFEDDFNIEKAMAKVGEDVHVVNNDNVLEMSLEDLVGPEALEKLAKGASTDGGDDNKTK